MCQVLRTLHKPTGVLWVGWGVIIPVLQVRGEQVSGHLGSKQLPTGLLSVVVSFQSMLLPQLLSLHGDDRPWPQGYPRLAILQCVIQST